MRYDRLVELENYISQKHYVSIEELLNTFNVSIQTLRRDLKALQDRKVITKIYGGVLYNSENFSQYATPIVTERLKLNVDAKEHIGQLAASIVEDNDIIFIDSGTTALRMVQYLKDKHNLTVVTHSIDVANLIVEMPSIQLITIGGTYLKDTRSYFIDSSMINYNFTKAFIACIGVSLPRGLTNENFFEASIKKKAISSSAKCYVLADSSKFDYIAFINFANLDKFTGVITNAAPSLKYTNYFEKNGIKCLY